MQGELTYLSPILISSLQRREMNPSHNVFKSDIYSFGMTILEMCSMIESSNYYNMFSYQINRPIVQ